MLYQSDILLKMNQQLVNKISDLVISKCIEISSGDFSEKDEKWPIFASFILTDEKITDKIKIICITTGSKWFSDKQISPDGKNLINCHAEVLAKRCFRRFLYKECQKLLENNGITNDDLILEVNGKYLEVKGNIKITLFINKSPCGAATREEIQNSLSALQSNQRPGVILEELPEIASHTNNKLNGNPYSLTCSDKISTWNIVGIQGTFLSGILKPVYIDNLILCGDFDEHKVYNAIIGRVLRLNYIQFIRTPSINIYKYNGYSRKYKTKPSVSINWIIDESEIERVNPNNGKKITNKNGKYLASRLSKYQLFKLYNELYSKYYEWFDYSTRFFYPEITSYKMCKNMVNSHRENIKYLYIVFSQNGLGNWKRHKRQIELEFFIDGINDNFFKTIFGRQLLCDMHLMYLKINSQKILMDERALKSYIDRQSDGFLNTDFGRLLSAIQLLYSRINYEDILDLEVKFFENNQIVRCKIHKRHFLPLIAYDRIQEIRDNEYVFARFSSAINVKFSECALREEGEYYVLIVPSHRYHKINDSEIRVSLDRIRGYLTNSVIPEISGYKCKTKEGKMHAILVGTIYMNYRHYRDLKLYVERYHIKQKFAKIKLSVTSDIFERCIVNGEPASDVEYATVNTRPTDDKDETLLFLTKDDYQIIKSDKVFWEMMKLEPTEVEIIPFGTNGDLKYMMIIPCEKLFKYNLLDVSNLYCDQMDEFKDIIDKMEKGKDYEKSAYIVSREGVVTDRFSLAYIKQFPEVFKFSETFIDLTRRHDLNRRIFVVKPDGQIEIDPPAQGYRI